MTENQPGQPKNGEDIQRQPGQPFQPGGQHPGLQGPGQPGMQGPGVPPQGPFPGPAGPGSPQQGPLPGPGGPGGAQGGPRQPGQPGQPGPAGPQQFPGGPAPTPQPASPAPARREDLGGPSAPDEQVPEATAHWFAESFGHIVSNVGQALLGKEEVIRLALTCLFSEGHMLLEDAPGTGKTALARAIAASVQGTNSRIQFTPDLLPSDITGVTVFDQKTHEWEFHKGPIFASIVLADEINRASPKTQSALLEVMEESQVTVDGIRHKTGRPFMVIATQNPIEQAGTYRLPEAQLDRFLMKTAIGYPSRAAGVEVLAGSAQPDRSRNLAPVVTTEVVADMATLAAKNYASRPVLEYVYALTEATRDDSESRLGVSIRGAIAMVRAARIWALSQGRNFVLPDDIKFLSQHVWSHRIVLDPDAEFAGATTSSIVERAIKKVPAPRNVK